jgi:hypothetical protein
MTVKDRFKNGIVAKVGERPLSLAELDAARRKPGKLHCSRLWLCKNLEELLAEDRLVFAVPKK